MKKIVIAAIMLASIGYAQADVSLYGKVREYQESYTVGSASAVTRLTNDTSRVGIKANQDVGNGMTVSAVVETGVAMDAPGATTLGDRIAIVSLSNKLGTVSAGRDKHPVTRALDNFDALENTYGTIAPSIHAAQGSRVQNALFVTTAPVMGLTANYTMSNSETANVNNTQAGSIDYTSGPLSVTVARYEATAANLSTIGGAKFTLAKTGTTVYGLYSEDTVAGVNSTGKSVGVRQAVSPQLALLGSYGENTAGVSGKAYGVAYSMSKALTLHARYSEVTATTNTKQYGVGLEYNF
jgi:hypothetical protein